MKRKKKKIKEICGNCRLYNHDKGVCKVAVTLDVDTCPECGLQLDEWLKTEDGIPLCPTCHVPPTEKINLPVFPQDTCHLEELGMEIQEIRWWVEDPNTGKETKGDGIVKMKFPKALNLWKGFLK